MFVVDASVWLSRFVSTDTHHRLSRSWVGVQLEQGNLLVSPALLLAEVAGAVARRTGLVEVAARTTDLIQRLPQTRLVPVDANLGLSSARLAAELRLKGADAVYVALAQRLNVPLVTWDREQLERGQHAVATLMPA